MTTLKNRTKSALLVIDVQVGVVSDAYQRDLKINNMVTAVEKARAANLPVIWIQHSDGSLVLESSDWEIVPELTPLPGDPMIRKTFRSSFVETNLEQVLEGLGISHLYVCGAETNNCVRHTCHTALDRGYDLTLISDAHTTSSFEWNGYIIDAARVIDDQNINFLGYKLPGQKADAVPVAELSF